MNFINIELTTICNAKCRMCMRMDNDIEAYGKFLDFNVIKKLPRFEEVKFIGLRGDPIFHFKFFDIIEHFNKFDTKIMMHTNGSVRPEKWWNKFGSMMKDKDRTVFGIDGFEDTHSTYRIGTDYNKIINNMKAYIEGGGKAIVQMLIFKYNQHQVEDLKNYVKDLGAVGFWKGHSFMFNEFYERPTNQGDWKSRVELQGIPGRELVCRHVHSDSVYLRTEGHLLPCCFMEMVDTFKEDKYNLKYNEFDDIIKDKLFVEIQNNYENFPVCQSLEDFGCRCHYEDIMKMEEWEV